MLRNRSRLNTGSTNQVSTWIVNRSASPDEYTKILLHCDGDNNGTTFTDSSIYSKTATPTNTVTSTDQKKFGATSAKFNGTSSYIFIEDNNDWDVEGDYTIDFWFLTNTASGVSYTKGILGTQQFGAGYVNGWVVGHYQGNLTVRVNGTTYSGSGTINTGTWYHIALVWSGSANTFKVYLDGNELYSGVALTTKVARDLYLGNVSPIDVNRHLDGYIDEFRISKGISRWTANFTPPTEAY